jgi:hypothetical protein
MTDSGRTVATGYRAERESKYPETGIADTVWGWAVDDAERTSTELDADSVGLFFLSETIALAFNPSDDDVAAESILADAVEAAALFIERQPCECPEGDDDDPCDRCLVLGRWHDEAQER